MAFYYHFKDIYDLVEWSCVEDGTKALQGKKTSESSIEYTISNNQLLMYEEPEEGNPTSVYNIKELTKSKLVLLYKVDDSDGYKAEITTTFKKI